MNIKNDKYQLNKSLFFIELYLITEVINNYCNKALIWYYCIKVLYLSVVSILQRNRFQFLAFNISQPSSALTGIFLMTVADAPTSQPSRGPAEGPLNPGPTPFFYTLSTR